MKYISGDRVILKDETHQNNGKTARITDVNKYSTLPIIVEFDDELGKYYQFKDESLELYETFLLNKILKLEELFNSRQPYKNVPSCMCDVRYNGGHFDSCSMRGVRNRE